MSGGEIKKRRARKRRIIIAAVLGVITIVVILGYPPVSRKNYFHAVSIQNAKHWGYALFQFESEYGAYPNEETAELLREKFPEQAHLIKTNTANDYMRQLVIAGFGEEKKFSLDSEYVNAAKMLDSGEFPFSYVVGLDASHESGRILLIGPLQKGKYVADEDLSRERFYNRSVVLCIDMSVRDPKLDEEFFDWSNPYWGGQKPKIVWPE